MTYTPITSNTAIVSGYGEGTSFIKDGYNLGWDRTREEWIDADCERCMICHPDPVPPFFDCPHGHSLTPSRVQQQIEWDFKSDFCWWTFLLVVAIVIQVKSGFAFFSAFIILGNIPWVLGYRRLTRIRRQIIARFLEAGPYSESPNWSWEKRTRRNEPWNGRVF